jgi:hypothetical protein
MSRISMSRPAAKSHWALCLCIALLAFSAAIFVSNAPVTAQQSTRTTQPQPRPIMPNVDPLDMPPVYAGDVMRERADAKRLQYLNTERQKSLVAATNRLVKMAADLNSQINNDQHSPISPDQIRQLADIEKLAHSIRDKMSTSVIPAATYDSGPGFIRQR